MAKKSSKKTSARAPSSLQVKLTRAHHAQAQKCLERSGKIRLGMKPVSVTKLPKTLGGRYVIMD